MLVKKTEYLSILVNVYGESYEADQIEIPEDKVMLKFCRTDRYNHSKYEYTRVYYTLENGITITVSKRTEVEG